MDDEFTRNFAVGAIRGLRTQNLITEEQMNLAIRNLKFPIEETVKTEQLRKEGRDDDQSSSLLQGVHGQ